MTPPLADVDTVLGYGDDALVQAQRLAMWCARGPELEEDVALANIALDHLGAARLLLSLAGEREGRGRDEDALAYLRADHEYRNVLLVELPDRDFATVIGKLLLLSAWQVRLFDGLTRSDDAELAAIAGKLVKEREYHLDHAIQWTLRLGDGTEESHARMQEALDTLWPYAREFDESQETGGWQETVVPVLTGATLVVPPGDSAPHRALDGGGRRGRHTEYLSLLLAEMQVVHRAHPGARW